MGRDNWAHHPAFPKYSLPLSIVYIVGEEFGGTGFISFLFFHSQLLSDFYHGGILVKTEVGKVLL